MRYQGFVGNSYTSQSLLADCEQSINWYRERIESPYGKTDYAQYPTPGFASYIDLSSVVPAYTAYPGGRAMSQMNGRALAVVSNGVFELFPAQYYSQYGTVAVDQNPAQIAWNGMLGNQALIASGASAYALDLKTKTVTQVLQGVAAPLQVAAIDGYGIAFDQPTGRIYVSKQNDFTSWDPTQFATRSAAPDAWQAMTVNPPDLWLIGGQSGDVWYDAGNFPFPFAPRVGLNFKYGIVAPWSLVAVGYSVIWLSQTPEGQGVVVRTSGYAPQRISTYPVETMLTQYARASTITDAEGSAYQEHGHTFYCLRLPSANATFVCDLETGDWHRRAYWNQNTNSWEAWRVRTQMHAFGHHLVGDPSTSVVSQLSTDFATELDGSPIRRLRRAPGPFSEHRTIPIRRLEIYLETGMSLGPARVTTPPSDQPGYPAYAMLRTSDDGGRTWGSERIASIGALGEYRQRGLRFHRLGTPYDRVHELTVSDPITAWRLVDAYINTDAPPTVAAPPQ
jgi:hypothetical protein